MRVIDYISEAILCAFILAIAFYMINNGGEAALFTAHKSDKSISDYCAHKGASETLCYLHSK